MEDLADFAGRTDLFRAVADWHAHGGERYFVLGGGVGTGKTTAMARLVAREPAVTARHFCDPRDLTTRNPVEAARSLSVQLAARIGGFTAALIGLDAAPSAPVKVTGTALADEVHPEGVNAGVFISTLVVDAPSDEAAWFRTVTGPLRRLVADHRLPPVLIAVDALDEADFYDGRTKLTDLVLGTGGELAPVRWLLSTRYPDLLAERLPETDVRQWHLSHGPGGDETRRDVRVFLQGELKLPDGPVLDLSDQRTGGNFLHARLLVETVRAAGALEPAQVHRVVRDTPPDLDGSQYGYLLKIVDGDPEIGWQHGYHPVFSALVAVQEPLDLPTLVRLSGVRPSVAARVLERIGPLLSPEAATAGERHSLYHAQFRAFLADRNRARRWWCDPEEAHQRVLDAYCERTADWTRWQRLDDYGARHLLTHARLAGWTAADFDRLLVPGCAARIAEGPDAAAAVLRALDAPIAVALAEPDLVRAVLWSWTARRIKGALLELLGADMPTLLVKAGHEDLALAGLSLTTGTGLYGGSRLAHVLTALAGEGRSAAVRTVLSLAGPDERPHLLAVAATALAPTDPDQAWALAEEALAPHGDPDPLYRGDRPVLLTALAAQPALADRALALAGDRRELLDAVAVGRARWDPQRAADLADEVSGPVRATVLEALAAVDPAHAHRLLGSSAADDWIRTRLSYRQALATGLPLRRIPEKTADPDALQDIDLLLLAAALTHDPDERALRASTDVLAGLSRPTAGALGDLPSPWPRLRAVDLVELDLAALRRHPLAARLGASVVFRFLQAENNYLRDPPDWERTVLNGRLCAALAALDPDAAAEIVGALTPEPNPGRDTFGEAVVAHLCPTDPEHAWRVAEWFDTHGVYRAWAEALPADCSRQGVRKVASIGAEFSATRAQLAGLLARKLPRGDRQGASELLRLVSPIAEGAAFRAEYDAMRAAFSPSPPDSLAEALRRRVELRPADEATTDPPEGPGLRAAAELLAARARHPGAALLAATALALDPEVAEGTDGPARDLLRYCLDPSYDRRVARPPTWPGVARAVRRTYGLLSPDAFVDVVTGRLRGEDAVEVLALLLTELPGTDRVAESAVRRQPALGTALEGVRMVCRTGRSPSDWLRRQNVEDPSDSLQWKAVHATMLALARVNPRAALDVPADPPGEWPAWLFPVVERSRLLLHVLPAVARADPDLAVAAARDLCERQPEDAVGRDALRGVALAVAEDDWHAGMRIARAIDAEDVRGPAVGRLVLAATRLAPAGERRRAYAVALEEVEGTTLDIGLPDLLQDFVHALAVDPDPPADIVARLIPPVAARLGTVREDRRFGKLARVVARHFPDGDSALPALRTAVSFVTDAWRL
ncbi:hypothetical protein K4B79_06395 [Streptomyces lincolnensis]|uniref:hypothetical protein n=1 Tax=Streptomyces lincolnensis TaxID=1915 RepID=UPI001E319CAF|nr:hypothetical protein [Streptomyces lincolnensis]MCD7437854.1 hypothetical protein [Streptomyces lincolnensis]